MVLLIKVTVQRPLFLALCNFSPFLFVFVGEFCMKVRDILDPKFSYNLQIFPVNAHTCSASFVLFGICFSCTYHLKVMRLRDPRYFHVLLFQTKFIVMTMREVPPLARCCVILIPLTSYHHTMHMHVFGCVICGGMGYEQVVSNVERDGQKRIIHVLVGVAHTRILTSKICL